MNIEGNIITFKSDPENFYKEKHGLKPCTIRKICLDSEKKEAERFFNDFNTEVDSIGMLKVSKIRIKNTITKEAFERTLTDITKFEGLWVFSWRSE